MEEHIKPDLRALISDAGLIELFGSRAVALAEWIALLYESSIPLEGNDDWRAALRDEMLSDAYLAGPLQIPVERFRNIRCAFEAHGLFKIEPVPMIDDVRYHLLLRSTPEILSFLEDEFGLFEDRSGRLGKLRIRQEMDSKQANEILKVWASEDRKVAFMSFKMVAGTDVVRSRDPGRSGRLRESGSGSGDYILHVTEQEGSREPMEATEIISLSAFIAFEYAETKENVILYFRRPNSGDREIALGRSKESRLQFDLKSFPIPNRLIQ